MITRRSFIRVSGAWGLLVIAPTCKGKPKAVVSDKPAARQQVDVVSSATSSKTAAPPVAGQGGGQLSPWMHVAENDVITYFVPEAEMGQGIHTAVAMVISAELGGAWEKAVAATAPLDPGSFGRQGTGGSTSIRLGFEDFRKVGAAARMLLIAAGAQAMGVPTSECEAIESEIRHTKSDRRIRFGEVAEAASTMSHEEQPALKTALPLGAPTLRLDSFAKVTGTATYGMDVQVPGMLVGKSVHSPSVGGSVKSVSDAAARAVIGVRDVVRTSSSVVVLADHTWAAIKGRDALKVEWAEPNIAINDASIKKSLHRVIDKGKTALSVGRPDASFAKAKTVVEAEYSVPYLAHAPMEPLNCTVSLKNDRCDIWTGTQSPSSVGSIAAEITGLPMDKIFVHSQYLGGGFGRRSKPDYVAEAIEAAKASGQTVKLIWDREQDIRGYQYRPTALNSLRAAVDPVRGTLLAWEHRIASPSILRQLRPLRGGIDGSAIEGSIKYAAPNMTLTYSDVDLPIPTWFWRSVGHSQNGFVVDSFMNEAAKAARRDPLEFRLSTKISRMNGKGGVEDSPRLKNVLEIVAEKAGWATALPEGRARGVSACESFGSFCAQVAEVSMDNGIPRVHKVTCVIDCGQQVNPMTIRAQMESAIVYGLGAALYNKVTFDAGGVVQGNFDRYQALRMHEMPTIDTTIVPSSEDHGGVGEPGTPPIAGALAGALYALDGKPVRQLPIL